MDIESMSTCPYCEGRRFVLTEEMGRIYIHKCKPCRGNGQVVRSITIGFMQRQILWAIVNAMLMILAAIVLVSVLEPFWPTSCLGFALPGWFLISTFDFSKKAYKAWNTLQ